MADTRTAAPLTRELTYDSIIFACPFKYVSESNPKSVCTISLFESVRFFGRRYTAMRMRQNALVLQGH